MYMANNGSADEKRSRPEPGEEEKEITESNLVLLVIDCCAFIAVGATLVTNGTLINRGPGRAGSVIALTFVAYGDLPAW